ncbi:aminoglycoside phosphotransferase family protein [Streptomyces sp. NBRC 109706]|uniref:aminoglycoside phosphotransferase family protein n=1 Tax=Streptomyces sp. NBRC 109706 TaxID=1550035 RepID=UPI000783367A|nr:aminoglycoside phosphotransferase family protein [Streptomyces sp. NBRC 109706]
MCAVKMHADEPDIDTSLVSRLIAARFPRWDGLPVTPVPSSGTDNAMFRLGGALVVRLPRTSGAADAVETEERWPTRLASHLPVPIPVPLEVGEPAEGYPWRWSVHRWLPGVNPVAGEVVAPLHLAEDLAEFVNALRAVDPGEGPRASRGKPLSGRDKPTRDALAQLAALAPEDEPLDLDAITRIWDEALTLPPYEGGDQWLHGDLSPGNVLVGPDGRLNAVIDFGIVGIGDPSVEQIVAWNLLPAEARPTFRSLLGSDEVTWARGRAWALSISLIQLPYYRITNPALAANSRHVIREILADAALGA